MVFGRWCPRGTPLEVISDLRAILVSVHKYGIKLNLSKCEDFIAGGTAVERLQAKSLLETVPAKMQEVPEDELSLIGSPLTCSAVRHYFSQKSRDVERLLTFKHKYFTSPSGLLFVEIIIVHLIAHESIAYLPRVATARYFGVHRRKDTGYIDGFTE